jgi:hypothetical protein
MGRVGPEQRSKPLIMLTKHALEEYKQIHREETGTVLPDDVLANEAINLLTLFNFVYRPIKKAWLQEYGQRQGTARGMDSKRQVKIKTRSQSEFKRKHYLSKLHSKIDPDQASQKE